LGEDPEKGGAVFVIAVRRYGGFGDVACATVDNDSWFDRAIDIFSVRLWLKHLGCL
jgi:hypothetical protein